MWIRIARRSNLSLDKALTSLLELRSGGNSAITHKLQMKHKYVLGMKMTRRSICAIMGRIIIIIIVHFASPL